VVVKSRKWRGEAAAAEAAGVEDRTGLRREVVDNTDEVHRRRVLVTDRP
jgi:hypothetical protein